jgi:hypothetical protein
MIYASLDSIRCHEETDEVGSDEPYVIVVSVDLKSAVSVAGFAVPIPATRAYRYGPFNDVDGAETHRPSFTSFWGLDTGEKDLSNPDDTVFIVGLMENDDGNSEALRGIVEAQAAASLFATLGVTDRTERVRRLMEAVNSALRVPTGGPSLDERIGESQELRFTLDDIALAETGNPALRSLQFRGDGGFYTVTFQARRRGQNAWRFCVQCRTLFYDGFKAKGSCPATGGPHAAAGFNFYLPHHGPGPQGGQEGWRFCSNCFAMYWSLTPAQLNRCNANPGSPHVFHPDSFPFDLPHDHNGPGQRDWRFCNRCSVMFFNGEANKGSCTAGGGHNGAGSFDFKLDFEP